MFFGFGGKQCQQGDAASGRNGGAARRLRVLFVGHDAALAGAQMLLLHALRWFKFNSDVDMYLMLLGDGLLRDSFAECCPVHLCRSDDIDLKELAAFCPMPDVIYGNTAVAARCYSSLARLNRPIITHVHELEQSLRKFAGKDTVQDMLTHSTSYIAASEPVRQNLLTRHDVAPEKVATINAFISPDPDDAHDKAILRDRLGLPQAGRIIVGCGSCDWRKGIDLFVEVARIVLAHPGGQDIHFCWVGAGEDPSIPNHRTLARKYDIADKMIFPGQRTNPKDYFRASDLFLLPSREDPFPLVALEAAECRLPVLCFADTGGMPAFVATGAGYVLPKDDIAAMADKALELLADQALLTSVGESARQRLLASHVTDLAAPLLLEQCRIVAAAHPPVNPNYPAEAVRGRQGLLDGLRRFFRR